MTNINDGIGFPGVLTTVFIVLKLIGTIQWSWWWVLSPIWIPFSVTIIIIIIIFILYLLSNKF